MYMSDPQTEVVSAKGVQPVINPRVWVDENLIVCGLYSVFFSSLRNIHGQTAEQSRLD